MRRHFNLIFWVCMSILLGVYLFKPAFAENASVATKPVTSAATPTQKKQAHEFLDYLVKLGVTEPSITIKCLTPTNIPNISNYIAEPCVSVFRVLYRCKNGKDKHVVDTRIDWRYISELNQSGYNHDGKDINISGNIAASYSGGNSGAVKSMSKPKPLAQTKITFDSAATAKRALNAFSLLKEQCDTSAGFPF